jgi:carbonic anhydrase/acetyltransferase-like protein (isoleucine patch superfamily)
MIRSFNNTNPIIDKTAYIDEQSTVIGNVKIGKDSAIWPQVVVRGDINSIIIGDRTNIQDGSILHVTHASDFCPSGYSLSIGNDVTVGHSAVIHACTIKDTVLIGMGSIILDGAIINSNCMLAAGALVGPGKELESGFLYVGSPAKKLREVSEREMDFLLYSAKGYVDLKNQYMSLEP